MQKIKKINLNGTNYLVGPTHVSELENDKGYFVATTDGDGNEFLANDGTYKGISGNIPVFDNIDQLSDLKVGEIASVHQEKTFDWEDVIFDINNENPVSNCQVQGYSINKANITAGGAQTDSSPFILLMFIPTSDMSNMDNAIQVEIALGNNYTSDNTSIASIRAVKFGDTDYVTLYNNGVWTSENTDRFFDVKGMYLFVASTGLSNEMMISCLDNLFNIEVESALSTYVKTGENQYKELGNIPVFTSIKELDSLKVGEIASVCENGVDWGTLIENAKLDIINTQIESFSINTDIPTGTVSQQGEGMIVGLFDNIPPTKQIMIGFALSDNKDAVATLGWVDVNEGSEHFIINNGVWNQSELDAVVDLIHPGYYIAALNEAGDSLDWFDKLFNVVTMGDGVPSTYIKTKDGFDAVVTEKKLEEAVNAIDTNIPVFSSDAELDNLHVGEIASVYKSGGKIDWNAALNDGRNNQYNIQIESLSINTNIPTATTTNSFSFELLIALADNNSTPYVMIGADLSDNNDAVNYLAWTDANYSAVHYIINNGVWNQDELNTVISLIQPGYIIAANTGDYPIEWFDKLFNVTLVGGNKVVSTCIKTDDGFETVATEKKLAESLTEAYQTIMGTIETGLPQLLTDYAKKTEIPTKVSQLDNDANYFVDAKPLPENGIYIYDIDGNFVNPSAWDTANNSKAVGVAVLDDNCKFVIAKEDVSQGSLPWGSENQVLPDVDDKFNDFDGVSNTSAIVAAYGTSRDYAALACTQYTFADSQQGYLGAYGEWYIVSDNIDVINELLSLINGTPIEGRYWTSTEMGYYDAFTISINTFLLGGNDKYNYCYVRAFLHVDSTKSILQRLDEVETKRGAYKLVESIANVLKIKPNTFYNFGKTESLGISFADTIPGIVNEYIFQFTSYTNASLSLPDTVKWANDTPPMITDGKTYQISIVNNLATVLEFN